MFIGTRFEAYTFSVELAEGHRGGYSVVMAAKRSTLLWLMLILVCGPVLWAQQTPTSDLSRFNYGKIPFGQSPDAVNLLIPKAWLTVADQSDFQAIYGYEGISSYFPLGTRTTPDGGIFLDGGLVLHEQVTPPEDSSQPAALDLYFLRSSTPGANGGLFIVDKVLLDQVDGQYPDLFEAMQESISQVLNIKPTLLQTTFEEPNLGVEPARIGIWESKTTRIFLFVRANLFNNSLTEPPEILYIDVAGWKQYLKQFSSNQKSFKTQTQDNARSTVENNF